MREPRIYLDHAATTPVRTEVRAAMAPFLGDAFGNPSSLHAEGRAAREALETAREDVREALGARDFRIAFTGGGTEADNAALLGVLLASGGGTGSRPHLVTSAVEHPAVLRALPLLERLGFSATVAPVDGEGRLRAAAVLSALRPETRLVSVIAGQNEVGTLEPIAEIGEVVRSRGIAFHT